MHKLIPCIIVLFLLMGTATPSVVEPDDVGALDEDERLLEAAGIPWDGPGLLEFFRARARIEPGPGRIDELVRRLAGPSFEDSVQAGADLVALGPPAISGLRRVANDLESVDVRERARKCLEWVEAPHSANLAAAAARVVARRKPIGAAEALLAYVPFADNEEVAREVTVTLQAIAVTGGQLDPVLVRALSDPLPLRRAVAGAVLGQAASAEQREAVEKLLRDPNPDVRLATALSLAKAHDVAAIPVLIDLVAVLPAGKRSQAEEVLQDLAGEWTPTGGQAGEDEIARRIRRDAWAAWWANTEGPALLAMIRKRTLTPSEREEVKAAIRRLGDSMYAVREKAVAELAVRGTMVLPLLREAAKSSELEVVRRAQRCIQMIEAEPAHRLPAPALRLLALRKPAGAVDALLAYLPFADDETLTEAQSALGRLAVRDGKPDPTLMRALAEPQALVRASAAEALAQGGGPEALPALHKLLGDADVTVRRRVALALAPKDARAIEVLIGLIAGLESEQAWQVHDFLSRLAGDKAPPPPEDNPEARKKASAAWATWWKENAAKLDLARLADSQAQWLGFTLIAEHDTGKIVELGRDRKPRWSFTGTQNPTDASMLPNNRVLVAEHTANRVTERDLKGNIVWQKQLTVAPHNAQRLPNGQTLIATSNQVLVVDVTGKEVVTISNLGALSAAYRLPNGQFVCMTQNGQCIRLDAAGKQQLKKFNTNRGNAWIDVQANGKILVAPNGGNKLAEFDRDGKLLLEIDIAQVSTVTGLPNGNFLAACHGLGRVLELDRKGKVIWEYNTQGPFRARAR